MQRLNIEQIAQLKDGVEREDYTTLVRGQYWKLFDSHCYDGTNFKEAEELENKTGVSGEETFKKWVETILEVAPWDTDSLSPMTDYGNYRVFIRLGNAVAARGTQSIEGIIHDAYVKYMSYFERSDIKSPWNRYDMQHGDFAEYVEDLEKVTGIAPTQEDIQKVYMRIFRKEDDPEFGINRLGKYTKVRAEIPREILLEKARAEPCAVMKLLSSHLINYDGEKITLQTLIEKVYEQEKIEFLVWLHANTSENFEVSEEDVQREYQHILKNYNSPFQLEETVNNIKKVYQKTGGLIAGKEPLEQVQGVYFRSYVTGDSIMPRSAGRDERDKERIHFLKVLEEMTVPMSEATAQRIYDHILTGCRAHFGKARELQELTGIVPNSQTIDRAYQINLGQRDLEAIEELYLFANTKPKYTEIEVQEAYQYLIKWRKFDDIAVLQRITEMVPKKSMGK